MKFESFTDCPSIRPNKEMNKENSYEKNDNILNEKLLSDYPMPISLEQNEKIIEQLKNDICNIYLGKARGTGFFMKIKFPDKEHLLPVLFTCNHVIDESFILHNDKINIEINGKNKTIELKDRIKYTDKEMDITIIEIKEKKDGIKHFLQLDEENQNFRITGKTIYILQYFDANGPSHPTVPSVSYGILKKTKDHIFAHCGSTSPGSSGSPILNLANNKVIGIHLGTYNTHKYNRGNFLNNPINDFMKKMYEENRIKSFMNHPAKKIHVKYIGTSINEEIENLVIEKELDKDKILNYNNNNLLNINFLEKKNLENYERLCLDNNKISEINILEKFRLKELKELYLNGNNIANIEILENINFPNLEILDLSGNKIINVDVFEKVNFPKLKILFLYRNRISAIDKINLAKFRHLEMFAISYNKIKNIKSLKHVKHETLQFLFLTDIKLEKINIFGSIEFKNLKFLALGGNDISDIKELSKVDFKELEVINLYDNTISDIEVLAEVNFPKLKRLNLANNLITNIEVLKDVNFPELYELDLQQNNIVDINVFKICKFKKLFKLNIKLNKIVINKNLDIINELKNNLNLFI